MMVVALFVLITTTLLVYPRLRNATLEVNTPVTYSPPVANGQSKRFTDTSCGIYLRNGRISCPRLRSKCSPLVNITDYLY